MAVPVAAIVRTLEILSVFLYAYNQPRSRRRLYTQHRIVEVRSFFVVMHIEKIHDIALG